MCNLSVKSQEVWRSVGRESSSVWWLNDCRLNGSCWDSSIQVGLFSLSLFSEETCKYHINCIGSFCVSNNPKWKDLLVLTTGSCLTSVLQFCRFLSSNVKTVKEASHIILLIALKLWFGPQQSDEGKLCFRGIFMILCTYRNAKTFVLFNKSSPDYGVVWFPCAVLPAHAARTAGSMISHRYWVWYVPWGKRSTMEDKKTEEDSWPAPR